MCSPFMLGIPNVGAGEAFYQWMKAGMWLE
jgi:hypothetical protein